MNRAPLRRYPGEDLGQVVLGMRQLPAEPGPQGGLNTLGELFQRQPARQEMLAQRDDSFLPVIV